MDARVAELVRRRDADPHEQGTDHWFDLRAGMLTASDVGAVLGLDPNHSRADVFRGKTTPAKTADEKRDGSAAAPTNWGHHYEAEAVKEYERRTGAHVLTFGLMRHATLDWLGASPDGITTDGVVLEIKVRDSPPSLLYIAWHAVRVLACVACQLALVDALARSIV